MAPEFVGGSMFLLKEGETITVNDPRNPDPIVVNGTKEGVPGRLTFDEEENVGILQIDGKTLYPNREELPDLFKLIEEGK